MNTILEHHADLKDCYLAKKRLAALRSGKSGTVALAELMMRYGMAGRVRGRNKKQDACAGSG
ncbi:MAG TPA: hypothetical protein VII56_03805 [Rhizomicrobium sp.]